MRQEFTEGPIPNYRAAHWHLVAAIVAMWLACFFAGVAVGYQAGVGP